MMAAGYGQLEIVEALLAAGADPRVSHGNVNALWAAAGFGAIADITDGPPLGSCFPRRGGRADREGARPAPELGPRSEAHLLAGPQGLQAAHRPAAARS